MRHAFFLWHLEHIGLIAREETGVQAPLWREAETAEPVTVALIDTGIDTGHPNLAGALAAPQVDFGVRLSGATFAPSGQSIAALQTALAQDPLDDAALVTALGGVMDDATQQSRNLGLDLDVLGDRVRVAETASPADRAAAAQKVLDALRVPSTKPGPRPEEIPQDIARMLEKLGLDDATRNYVNERTRDLLAGPEVLPLEDVSRYFGAHGTASAGLICGRPADDAGPGALPYRGANPYARLVTYATPFSHEIRPVMNAILAAYLSGAMVIVIPRGIPDVEQRGGLPVSDLRTTRIEAADGTTVFDDDQANFERLSDDAKHLEALLTAVSRTRYLILAAGNEGWADRVGYPASAVVDSADAIIVGAETADGKAASYSNGTGLGRRILYFISDDEERLDADGIRVNRSGGRNADFDFVAHAGGSDITETSPFAPLTTDVRGGYGYSASSAEDGGEADDDLDRPALYTLFGGTSAACSIAAGVVSLLVQAGRLPRDGGASAADVERALQDAGINKRE